MPFRKENRFISFLVLATLVFFATGVFGIYIISAHGKMESTPLYFGVAGVLLIGLKILLGMVQSEHARKSIIDTLSAKVDTATVNQTRSLTQHADQNAVSVAKSAAAAEHVCLTQDEVKRIVVETIRLTNMAELCQGTIRSAAVEAARETINQLRQSGALKS